jgi:hypothetical protein
MRTHAPKELNLVDPGAVALRAGRLRLTLLRAGQISKSRILRDLPLQILPLVGSDAAENSLLANVFRIAKNPSTSCWGF